MISQNIIYYIIKTLENKKKYIYLLTLRYAIVECYKMETECYFLYCILDRYPE